MISDETLAALEALSERCHPGPWIAYGEGRDQDGGDSIIGTGPPSNPGPDIYVSTDERVASADVLDLIAAARTYLPELVAEVRAARRA